MCAKMRGFGARGAALSWMVAMIGSAAFAGDGQIDLRLDPAETTVISQSGSYVVVNDVTMTADVPAITINAGYVTIDLNGHTIFGKSAVGVDGITTGNAGAEVHNGSLYYFKRAAVNVNSSGHVHDLRIAACGTGVITAENSRITNITAQGLFDYGVLAGLHCQVEGVNVGSAKTGIYVGSGTEIKNCRASFCTQDGILGLDAVLVQDCVADYNQRFSDVGGYAGIHVGANSTIRNSHASYNAPSAGAGAGIIAATDCLVEGNVCNGNNGGTDAGGAGISAGARCKITGNTCNGNMGGANSGSGYGINALWNCDITNNTASNNDGTGTGAGYGIITTTNSRVDNNTATDNDAGASGTSAVGIGVVTDCMVTRNVCSQNNEGTNATGTAYGISAGVRCMIAENTCSGNGALGAGGSGYGISLGAGSTARRNQVNGNVATGSSNGAGIFVFGSDAFVEGNFCETNSGGLVSAGILVATGAANATVKGNTTSNNGTSGIRWATASTVGRAESNIMSNGDGAIVNPPTSVGTGDLGNLSY